RAGAERAVEEAALRHRVEVRAAHDPGATAGRPEATDIAGAVHVRLQPRRLQPLEEPGTAGHVGRREADAVDARTLAPAEVGQRLQIGAQALEFDPHGCSSVLGFTRRCVWLAADPSAILSL